MKLHLFGVQTDGSSVSSRSNRPSSAKSVSQIFSWSSEREEYKENLWEERKKGERRIKRKIFFDYGIHINAKKTAIFKKYILFNIFYWIGRQKKIENKEKRGTGIFFFFLNKKRKKEKWLNLPVIYNFGFKFSEFSKIKILLLFFIKKPSEPEEAAYLDRLDMVCLVYYLLTLIYSILQLFSTWSFCMNQILKKK